MRFLSLHQSTVTSAAYKAVILSILTVVITAHPLHSHMQTIEHHHHHQAHPSQSQAPLLGIHKPTPFGPEAQAQTQEAIMPEVTYRAALASAPFTTTVDWASSLEAHVIPILNHCTPCLRRIPVRKAAKSITAGTVVYLPDGDTIPEDSIVRRQKAVNAGAYAHPGLALLESRCGHLVFVAPVTSFGGAGIHAKYTGLSQASKNDIFWRYLALDTHTRPPHNDLRALETAGDELFKPSYVHLEHGYWIERVNLKALGGHKRRLTFVKPAVLKYAQWAYCAAEKYRQAWGLFSQVEETQKQQPERSAAGTMQHRSTSPAVPTKMGAGQGIARTDAPLATPSPSGKDAASWRGKSSWAAVAAGGASGAS